MLDESSADIESVSISLALDDNIDSDDDNAHEAFGSTELAQIPINNRKQPDGERRRLAHQFQIAILGGATEQLFISQILIYLGAKELCVLAEVSRFFAHASSASHLWSDLIKRDFQCDEIDVDGTSMGTAQNSQPSMLTLPSAFAVAPKNGYQRRYREVKQRIQQKIEGRHAFESNLQAEITISRMEQFLDFTQVRLLIPLPMISLFLSMVLFTLHYDGLDISIWACAAPLLFFFAYLGLCILVARFVYNNQYTNGTLNGMWQNMRGPVKIFFSELLGENGYLAYFTIIVLALFALQICLVAVKLAGDVTPSHIVHSFPWVLVFVPIWTLFALYCIAPAIGCVTDTGVFLLGAGLFWIPFFILCVCLVVKLYGQENHLHTGHIRLALIFMPFWVLEGSVMLGSLIFLLIGIHRYVFQEHMAPM